MIQAYKGAARFFGSNVEEQTESPVSPRQKEIYENLPLPDTSEPTTTSTKNGQRRSPRDDVSDMRTRLGLNFN